MHHLNAQGHYRAVYVNVEGAQATRGDIDKGMAAIVSALASAALVYWDDEALFSWTIANDLATPNKADLLRRTLEHWSRQSTKPIVLFIDEVDALERNHHRWQRIQHQCGIAAPGQLHG